MNVLKWSVKRDLLQQATPFTISAASRIASSVCEFSPMFAERIGLQLLPCIEYLGRPSRRVVMRNELRAFGRA